jgi:hypothetical protein
MSSTYNVFTAIEPIEAESAEEAFKKWLKRLAGMVVIVEEQDAVGDRGGRLALGGESPERSEFEKGGMFGNIRINEFVLPMNLEGPPETWEPLRDT